MRTNSVVFIVAHPDDVAHAMGGTAWLLHKKYNLHVFCATKGQHGITDKTPDEAAAIREQEEMAVCRKLNASLTFLSQMDGEVYSDRETCKIVTSGLKRLQPKAIFTLWPVNRHPDHVAAYDIAMQAVRLSGISRDTDVYMAENDIGGITRQFEPDILVDISDVIEQKKELVRLHKSQNQNEEAVSQVISRNVFRAKFASCTYVEAFKMTSPVTVYQTGHVAGQILINIRNTKE
ncbi:MAG: PIG-L family deacetylase [Victivallaceae bacterium]|jgi:LmbE family N-acetylglucosaminyl deacetylase